MDYLETDLEAIDLENVAESMTLITGFLSDQESS